MGLCQSKNKNKAIRYWNKRIPYPILNKEKEKYKNEDFLKDDSIKSLLEEAEELRFNLSCLLIDFFIYSGGIVLQNPKISSCLHNMFIAIKAEDLKNKSQLKLIDSIVINFNEELTRETITIKGVISDDLYDTIIVVNDFIYFIRSNIDRIRVMHVQLIKTRIDYEDKNKTQKAKKAMTGSFYDIINHAILAYGFFFEYFKNFNEEVKEALEKIHLLPYRNELLRLGQLCVECNISNPIQICWEFTDEKRLDYYKQYHEIIKENKENKETRKASTDEIKKLGIISSPSKLRSRLYKAKSKHVELNQDAIDLSDEINTDILIKKESELSK